MQDAFGRGGRVGGTERSQVLRAGAAEWGWGWLLGKMAGEHGRRPQKTSPVLGLARSKKEEKDARPSTCRKIQAQRLGLGQSQSTRKMYANEAGSSCSLDLLGDAASKGQVLSHGAPRG